MKIITNSMRAKAAVSGAMMVAAGAIALGASVTSSAMAADAEAPSANDSVVIGVANVGTDGTIDGYQCSFTDLPMPAAIPVAPSGTNGDVNGSSGDIVVADDGIVSVTGDVHDTSANPVPNGIAVEATDSPVGPVAVVPAEAFPGDLVAGEADVATVIASLDVDLGTQGATAVSSAGGTADPAPLREGTPAECDALRATVAP